MRVETGEVTAVADRQGGLLQAAVLRELVATFSKDFY